MQLPMAVVAGVRDGRIRFAYRRWEQPRVRVGGSQLAAGSIITFEALDEITDLSTITDADARGAGFADADGCRHALSATFDRGPRGGKGGDRVFRVTLGYGGVDPRIALRDHLPDDIGELAAQVARLDASRRSGPWTRTILEWIGDHEGVVSTELAGLLGRDLLPMKADIRRLKALGLTESLRVGYRLSPRGRSYLESLG